MLANSRASSSVSVMSSDNGQFSPAASNRRIVNRTVDVAVPNRRAISRVGIPADFNLITSRTWRTASLSVGIQAPFAKPKGGTVSEPERGLVASGDIIPECCARSSRSGGRDQIGTEGEMNPESWAASSGMSNQDSRGKTARDPGQVPARPCDAALPLSRDFDE